MGQPRILYRFFSRIIEVIQNDRPRIRNRLYSSLNDYYSDIEHTVYSVVSVNDGDFVKALLAMYQRSHQFAFNLIEQLDEKNRRNMPKQRV